MSLRFSFLWPLTAVAMIVLLAGAQWSGAAAQTASTVQVGGNAELGSFLTGPDDMTLYIFTRDTPGVSTCFDTCEENWPPLVVADGETPTAAAGIAGALTIFERPDGSRQVVLDDQPLYYFTPDAAPGESKGQNVGTVWFVISAATDGEVLRVGSSADLGPVVTGPNGMTLYVFANDSPGESVCYGQCETNWPPLIVADGVTPVAAPGVSAGVLGTTTRDDGAIQVTLDDRPLYYWAFDEEAGDSTGHGVGNVWFALDASGAQHPFVQEDPTPTAVPATPAPTEAPGETPAAPAVGNAGIAGTGSGSGSLGFTELAMLAAVATVLVMGIGGVAGLRRRQS